MSYNLIPLSLEQHQQILYEILYMVDDFCKAHDVPYFLVGGSLLGAVRHQGIIPWDDDVDIGMTRENYERFIILFHTEGVDGYELYDYEHTDGFLFPFAKIAKKDTWTDSKGTHKIHIDLFAYDGCGDSLDEAQLYYAKNRKKIARFSLFFISDFPFRKIYDCWKAKVMYFLTEFTHDLLVLHPLRLSPQLQKKYLSRIISHCSRLCLCNTKYCACIVWGIYGKGEVQPSSSFLNLSKMLFGSRELPVPSGWHDYLTSIYGDYRIPLPENKRIRHLSQPSCLVAFS